MNKILLFGAGKSSSFLIQYLLHHAAEHQWVLQIVDTHTVHLAEKYSNHAHLQLHEINVHDQTKRNKLVQDAALVISLLPPFLHIVVAKDCLAFGKNLITASYVSPEIQDMQDELVSKNVLFMCEMGLDPGIDHLSAMKIIHDIEAQQGQITSFKSHCGGLIAPESDTNPWHYKISWNPRNVITAGAAGAHFLQNGQEHHVVYQNIFKNKDTIEVNGIGTLAYYPNRDSIGYKDDYHLTNVQTLMRTTLRYPAYQKAWHYMINLKLTNENDTIFDTNNISFEQWLQQVWQTDDVSKIINETFKDDDDSKKLFDYLALTSTEIIGIGAAKSSADILQSVIEKKWKMEETDKDMIVMQHEFEYLLANEKKYWKSTLIVKGQDKTYTAMAKTVGLPMAILAKLLLTKKISGLSGVHIPVLPQIYEPVLAELEKENIIFTEEITTIS
jgi:saccharopine dehydrogenase-like NADP-dependent oxidoreductase